MVGAKMLFSCTTPEDSPQQMKELERISKKSQIDLNDPRLTFAAVLSEGLKDETLRSFVFDKTQEQFDGDLNFLYYTEKSTPVGGSNSKSVTFEEALFGSPGRFRMSDTTLDFDPLMQVALRGEEEDLLTIQSLGADVPVMYISADQDLDQNPIVPVFYSDGKVGEWDINQVPEDPVLIVGLNERLIKVERGASQRLTLSPCLSASDPYFSDGMNDYYFYTDYYCDDSIATDPGVGTGEGSSTSCDRDMNTKDDHVNQVRFNTINDFFRAENWRDGEPEVYFIIFSGSSNANLQQIRKNVPIVARNRWKNCSIFKCVPEWVYTDIELFHWDKSIYGEIVKIRWFEFDGGGTKTIETGMSVPNGSGGTNNLKFSTTINLNDYDLGDAVVEYCDNASYNDFKIQSSSSILFGLRLDD